MYLKFSFRSLSSRWYPGDPIESRVMSTSIVGEAEARPLEIISNSNNVQLNQHLGI